MVGAGVNRLRGLTWTVRTPHDAQANVATLPLLTGSPGRVAERSDNYDSMLKVRCGRCAALLLKRDPIPLAGAIQIKCRRCRYLQTLRPGEALSESRELPSEQDHEHPA